MKVILSEESVSFKPLGRGLRELLDYKQAQLEPLALAQETGVEVSPIVGTSWVSASDSGVRSMTLSFSPVWRFETPEEGEVFISKLVSELQNFPMGVLAYSHAYGAGLAPHLSDTYLASLISVTREPFSPDTTMATGVYRALRLSFNLSLLLGDSLPQLDVLNIGRVYEVMGDEKPEITLTYDGEGGYLLNIGLPSMASVSYINEAILRIDASSEVARAHSLQAGVYATQAEASKQGSDYNVTQAYDHAQRAESGASSASFFADGAKESRDFCEQAVIETKQSAKEALFAASDASNSAGVALTQASLITDALPELQGLVLESKSSLTEASSKIAEIQKLNTETEATLTESKTLLSEAQNASLSAVSSAENALSSENRASQHAFQASFSEENARTSENNSKGYATSAVDAFVSAQSSASLASSQADLAEQHRDSASLSVGQAQEQAQVAMTQAREATKQAGIATTKATEAATILASSAKVDAANVFSQPQVFNGVVSLNNGANSPTGKVTAQNLYDVTKLALTSDLILPILATDTPVDVLTFTAPSEGVYQVLACLYAREATADSASGASSTRLVASLLRQNAGTSYVLPNALITRFKPVTSPATPYYETYFGASEKVECYAAYGSRLSFGREFPYYVSFKLESQKLKAGDKLVLQGHGWLTNSANTARMKALSGSFLHVTKLI